MTNSKTDRPAILGGAPLCASGPPDWPGVDPEVSEAVGRALRTGSWGKYHGPSVPALVDLLAEAHGVPHAILCCSGTAAIELALGGVPIGSGDEVILSAYDFKGNFSDVLAVGGVPVLVDVLPGNWNLDSKQLAAAISPRTRAILVSHLHGGVVDMPAVMGFARQHQLVVIEDAAQCPGAWIHGRTAGTWGDVGVLSFGGSKLVSAGRGGALVTSRDDIAQRVRLRTQRGNEAYPLSELQAAAVIPQWRRLPDFNARRRAAVARLCERATELPGLRLFGNPPSDSLPGYYKLGIQYDPAEFGGLSRDRFSAAFRAEGIALDAGFRALHKIHAARRYRAVGSLEEAGQADEGILTLHHPILLEGDAAAELVVAAVNRVRRFAGEIATADIPECAF